MTCFSHCALLHLAGSLANFESTCICHCHAKRLRTPLLHYYNYYEAVSWNGAAHLSVKLGHCGQKKTPTLILAHNFGKC